MPDDNGYSEYTREIDRIINNPDAAIKDLMERHATDEDGTDLDDVRRELAEAVFPQLEGKEIVMSSLDPENLQDFGDKRSIHRQSRGRVINPNE